MISNEELSNRFDVLYNNITSSQAPGLDEYEKSVFLNKAQLEVLKNHLNPKGNKYGEGIDFSSKRQLEFSPLIVNIATGVATDPEFCHSGKRFDCDISNALHILNERVVVNNRTVPVVALNHTEYDTLMSRPYQKPPRSQAWRLLVNGHVEIVTEGGDPSIYHVRYIRVPHNVNLAGTTETCELPDFLVDEVLQRAVELAKAAYVGDMNHQQLIQAMGERSE